MNIFKFLRPQRATAPVARERLQILLSHERLERTHSDLLGKLREEILAVVSRHITLDPNNVQVRMDRGGTVSTLAVDIEIPHAAGPLLAAAS